MRQGIVLAALVAALAAAGCAGPARAREGLVFSVDRTGSDLAAARVGGAAEQVFVSLGRPVYQLVFHIPADTQNVSLFREPSGWIFSADEKSVTITDRGDAGFELRSRFGSLGAYPWNDDEKHAPIAVVLPRGGAARVAGEVPPGREP
jgi:hypothetical protein